MKNKIWLISSLSLLFAQSAHAIVILPPGPPAVMANCDITRQNNPGSPPAILNDKAELQSQLCILQNTAKMQRQSIQNLQQNLNNTESQIQSLQQKITAANKHSDRTAFEWVSASAGTVPHHAFVAAENSDNKVYLCQAAYTMSPGDLGAGNIYLYPGALTSQGCTITFAGRSFVENPYKILISKKPGYWGSQDQAGNPPSSHDMSGYGSSGAQPIIGGYEPDHYIYICRVNVNNTYYVGKVVSGNCNIALQGKEASWPNYQVLLDRQPTAHSNS